jgi:hypothetical protein
MMISNAISTTMMTSRRSDRFVLMMSVSIFAVSDSRGGSISEGRDGSGMPGTGYRAAVRQTAPADAIKIHGVPNRALDHLVGAFALTAVCKSVSSLSKPSRCPHTRWHFLNRFQTTWDLERSDVGSLPPRLIDPA